MASKKKQLKTNQPETATSDVSARPGASDYIRAVASLFFNWLKSNKLRFFMLLSAFVLFVVLIFLITRPQATLPANDQIVITVNRELGITGDGNPAVLTVEDKTRATQPFLDQAKNGDKVLLYYKAGKSVLFRPSENRIIHHGTYTPPEAKIFIRNGTVDDSKLSDIEDKLKSVDDIEIVSQDSSAKQDYKGITLVSVTDRYDQKISELENLFNTEVVRLPAGESFPEADILIIVGD